MTFLKDWFFHMITGCAIVLAVILLMSGNDRTSPPVLPGTIPIEELERIITGAVQTLDEINDRVNTLRQRVR